ncbi:MAG: hypothetical protein ABID09_08595 [Candidatus Omnitrophota bacterium]
MVKSHHSERNDKNGKSRTFVESETVPVQYKRLASMGKVSVDIINKLYDPIDAINRFINLALQSVEEDSQSRQFLLESKSGIRKMSSLLNELNIYAGKLEKEMRVILEANE